MVCAVAWTLLVITDVRVTVYVYITRTLYLKLSKTRYNSRRHEQCLGFSEQIWWILILSQILWVLEFSEDSKRYWYADNSFLTTFWTTLSSLFPEGETFFVDSVKNYRHEIKDQLLKDQVSGFIGQEALHPKEHQALNDMADPHGLPRGRIEKDRTHPAADRRR